MQTECSACPSFSSSARLPRRVLDHARVLVLRLGLVDDMAAVLGLGLERSHGQRDQRARSRRARARSAAPVAAPAPRPPRSPARRRGTCAACPPAGSGRARRASVPDEASRRSTARTGARPRSRRPRPSAPPSRIAQGDTAPRSSTGTATSTSTATSEPRNAPAEIASSASTATSSSGSAANGTSASSTAAASASRQSAAHVRIAVGPAAPEPVADGERHEHDADRVRPDDRRGAEVGSEQPHGRDLRAERARPDHEDEQGQRRHSDRHDS